jgi:hypothetical protein
MLPHAFPSQFLTPSFLLLHRSRTRGHMARAVDVGGAAGEVMAAVVVVVVVKVSAVGGRMETGGSRTTTGKTGTQPGRSQGLT